jgi:hypothetical protein
VLYQQCNPKEFKMATVDLASLKVGDFSAAVGTGFEIKLPQSTGARAATTVVPLKLVKAEPNGVTRPDSAKPDDKVRDGGGFSLEFVAPEDNRLPQGIYKVDHPKLGAMDVFLVPSGPVPGGFGYHTTFG